LEYTVEGSVYEILRKAAGKKLDENLMARGNILLKILKFSRINFILN
jgi:hypothetical protein